MGLTFDFFNTLIEPKNKYVSEKALKAVYDVGMKYGITIDFADFLNKALTQWQKVLRKRMEEGTETLYTSHLVQIFKEVGMQASDASAVIKESTTSYFEILKAGVQLVEGAQEVIGEISKKYRIGLITNFTYPPFVRDQLAQYNLSDFFEVVTISGDHGFAKPFPKIFTHTVHLMNLKPNNVVHIGDSLECDVIGAKKAGLKAVWLKRNNEQKLKEYVEQKMECEHRSDCTIHQLPELLEVDLDSLISRQKNV